MVNILPFQRTSRLISEIDEFFDKVSEASMVLEKALLHYLDKGPEHELEEQIEQILRIEDRADELRRSVANFMYGEMLMPDTRGDVLTLMSDVDTILDSCVHMLIRLDIERPDLPAQFQDGCRAILAEATQALDFLLKGARAYFREPHAVRDHVHKVSFRANEAKRFVRPSGSRIFASELSLERKRQLVDWLVRIRQLASDAQDIADALAVLAVKRAF